MDRLYYTQTSFVDLVNRICYEGRALLVGISEPKRVAVTDMRYC